MDPTPPFDRREFLKRGLQACALTSSAAMASLALARCAPNASSHPTTTELVPRPLTTLEWRRLGHSMTGALVLPSSPTYPTDRLLYNSKFSNLHPAAIAYCANTEDVVRCIDFVASHGIEVCARSGGHSYGGYSGCSGLVVDVSRLNSVMVDSKANVATVGAGARLIDVYNAVGQKDRLLPGGTCPSVGIAGLALGGGVGVFGRKFGLTSDNLRSAKVVTAAGELLRVDSSSHSDLLWALQGGGGGNFAIVTSFEFEIHPMPQVTLFNLQFPWGAAAAVLMEWQQWIALAPDELWSNCQFFSLGTNGYLAQISGVFCGTPSALASHLSQLRSTIGTPPVSAFVGSDDYVRAMKIEAGCAALSIASCHLPMNNGPGVLSREAYSAKSSHLNEPSTAAHAALLVRAVDVLKEYAPTVGGGLAFDAYGGAINRVDRGQTAFVHREKLAGIQATYSWSSYTPLSEITAGQRWLSWLGSDVFDAQAGAYQNYIDPTLINWETAY